MSRNTFKIYGREYGNLLYDHGETNRNGKGRASGISVSYHNQSANEPSNYLTKGQGSSGDCRDDG